MMDLKSRKGLVLLFLIVFQVLLIFSSLNNAKAVSDDDHLEVTLNCRLESDSSEIHSNLMPIGNYDFFETPNLDTGSFSHDNTRIDVKKIQFPNSNSTVQVNRYNVNDTTLINSSQLPEYLVSAPKDTIIQVKINYTTNATELETTNRSPYDLAYTDYIGMIEYNNEQYFHTIYNADGTGGQMVVYDKSFIEIEKITMDEYIYPNSCFFDGTYWWVAYAEIANKVLKYDSDFNYLGEEHELTTTPVQSITQNGTNFIQFRNGIVCIYDINWNYEKYYSLIGLNDPRDIEYYDNYWYVTDYNDACVYKYDLDFNYIEKVITFSGAYGICRGGNNNDNDMVYWNLQRWTGLGNDNVQEFYSNSKQHFTLSINNFSYQILGTNYTNNVTLVYDSTKSNRSDINNVNQGNITYYFDSSMLSDYNHVHDLTILSQNLSLLVNSTYQHYGHYESLNLTIWLEYSSNEWVVPSQDTLSINSEEVTDQSFNSGYVAFDDYSESLSITADRDLYFELNITTYFTFKFDLETISKTYLTKSFKLLSDHSIIIDEVELSSNLDVKKCYLNNIDLGKAWGYYGSIYNNTEGYNYTYDADQTMNENNIFTLEVILSEELYLPLTHVYNSLSGGTSNLYFSIYTNTLSIDNFNQYSSFNPTFPSNWNVEQANFTVSNIQYTPYYVSNESENEYGLGCSTPTNDYAGTYSFTDDVNGGNPEGWVIDETHGTVNVIASVDGHDKVMELHETGTNYVYAYQTFTDGAQMTGTVELWIRPITGSYTYITLHDHSDNTIFNMVFESDLDVAYFHGGGSTYIDDWVTGTWYHIKIEFDCSVDKYSMWRDVVLEADDVVFTVPDDGSGVESLRLITRDGYVYFDAIGYSWDSEYSIGDNKLIKNATILDVNNLYSRYDQDENATIRIQLRDVYNNPLDSKTLNYSIQSPNNTYIANSSKMTNATGYITIRLNFSLAFEQGFYHLNVSFYGSISYLSYWKLISFEIIPIERIVNNASVINLTINSNLVGGDNFIQINHSSSFTFNHLDNCTFDFSVVFRLNYSINYTYSTTFDYTLTFSSTNDISSVSFLVANITNYPSDFVEYRFDNAQSTNYQVLSNKFQILDVIGDSFNNLDNFNAKFRKYENNVIRTQQTTTPSTESESVVFTETLIANRSFNYYYYKNVDSLTINSLSLYHSRTGTTINMFTESGLKYYFEEDCNAGDQFTSTIDINPNWDVSYNIIENTGIYSNIIVKYKSDLAISGVSMILDFGNYSLYNENWSLGNQDSSDFKLTIPNVDFTDEYQYINLIGESDVPMATFSDIYSDDSGVRIIQGRQVDFYGYLNYSKFSQIYRVEVETDWSVYNIYYGNENYTTRAISKSIVEFDGSFNPNITDSYIHFRTDPFESVQWEINEKEDQITITIEASLAVDNAYFMYQFEPSNTHTLSSNSDLIDLSTSEIPTYLTFGIDRIEAGITIIEINIRYITAMEMLVQGIIIFSIAGIVITFYYKYERDDKFRKKVIRNMKKIENRLKKDEKEFKSIKEIKISEGKMYAK